MAATDKFQGDDIPITIGLTDTDDAAINIDDLAELYVFIILTKSNTTAVKFSKAGSGDYVALRKVSTTSYIAEWLSGKTKDATVGSYHIEVNVAETDAEYESSIKNTLVLDRIINLKGSTAKSVSSG